MVILNALTIPAIMVKEYRRNKEHVMDFGEWSMMKIPGEAEDEQRCAHSEDSLTPVGESFRKPQKCLTCGKTYHLLRCTECDQWFKQCSSDGCNHGKITTWV